jgi:phage tail-like protein
MTTLGLNAAFSLGTNLLGVRNDPYTAFNFLVEIESLLVGGFSEVRGLEVETEVEEYREGGVNEYVEKLPGRSRYPSNLTLQRGLTDIETLWRWHQEVIRGK